VSENPGKWRDIAIEDLERHADNMTLFGRDFTLLVDGKPLDTIPTNLFVNEIDVDTGDITAVTYTTNIILDDPIEPLNEREQMLCDWWAKKIEEDLIRQLLGKPSEYQQSLRAAGAKV
jgi:hypothetical protein